MGYMFWIEVLIVIGIVISSMCGLFLKLGDGQEKYKGTLKYLRIVALITVIVLAVLNISMKLIVFMIIFTVVNKIVFMLLLKGFKSFISEKDELTKGIFHVMVIVALLITIFTVVFSMNITNIFFKDKKGDIEEEVKTEQVEQEQEKEEIDQDKKDNEDVEVSKDDAKEKESEELKEEDELEQEGKDVKEEVQEEVEVEDKSNDYDWLKEKEDKKEVGDITQEEKDNEDVSDKKEKEQQENLNVCVDLNTASKWELLEVLDLGEPLVELIRSKRPYETFEEVGHVNGINKGIVEYLEGQNVVSIGCK